jgi:alcohol dehydrogenase (cytochrome c)
MVRNSIRLSIVVLLSVFVVAVAHFQAQLSWRLRLYEWKLTGRLDELGWSDLLSMTGMHDRFQVGEKIAEGRGIDAAVKNPYKGREDLRTGEAIFKTRCAPCHGIDATGGHGPSLIRSSYSHGDSDLSIYRVLRDGIPGTAMIATDLHSVERWQVLGYLRKLQRAANGGRQAATSLITQIRVDRNQLTAAGTKSDEWLTYSGSYNGWRYSSADQIRPSNVAKLRLKWVHQLTSGSDAMEGTPLITGGVLFLSESPSNAVAIDVKKGTTLWHYAYPLPEKMPICCGWVNRGLAILGSRLFLGTLDGHLVSLDAASGSENWDVEVAKSSEGYSITAAPLAIDDMIVVGVSGGEYGIRGFLAAYDAETGKERWRFDTIPSPGALGHDTWGNDAWRTGGGPTWVTGSYDPDADLLYWGVGNPSPDYQGMVRPGDNLFTDSVIALNAHTGKLAWYFQFTPHDEHDWDSNQTPVLADLSVKGTPRKAICWANRNGFYYVLDRMTGQFLGARAFVRQNWTAGIDSTGRPMPAQTGKTSTFGSLTYPGVAGGTNWMPPSYSPKSGLVFVHTNDQGSVFTSSDPKMLDRGRDGIYVGSGAASSEPVNAAVKALDAATGIVHWEYRSPKLTNAGGFSGLLATAGGLVFGGAGGYFFALDAADGRELWSVFLGGDTRAPPVSFVDDGQQELAVIAGHSVFMFGL